MAVALTEWIDLLRREYLAEFIPSGGAAVKLAVAAPEEAAVVLDAVAGEAGKLGYRVARVDAAQTRVQRIDRLFFAVAGQLDWDTLTERYLRGLLREHGIRVEDEQPLHDMDAIAAANGRLRPDLFGEINRLIANRVLGNYALAREFRTAIAMLCWGRINPQNVSPTDAEIIKQWLVGEKCSLAALKRLQIYQRIGRHNARLLLGSLAGWLPEAGEAGLALLLDLNAVVTDRPPADGLLRYTRNAVLDTYEVLRQFIDDTDEMSHLLLVGVAGPGLLDDPKRSVDNYTALKLRTADEVRDRSRANPLNAMVRLDVER
jgi:bacteriophage exclusion system BrxC/D-like protein